MSRPGIVDSAVKRRDAAMKEGKKILTDPLTGTVSYNLSDAEREALYAARAAEAAALGDHPIYGLNPTKAESAERAAAAAAQRVRLVASSQVAPPKPSFLQRAYEGCVGAMCGRRKKTEGGRRRRHHKGKKTLKRRSTRRHRRHR